MTWTGRVAAWLGADGDDEGLRARLAHAELEWGKALRHVESLAEQGRIDRAVIGAQSRQVDELRVLLRQAQDELARPLGGGS